MPATRSLHISRDEAAQSRVQGNLWQTALSRYSQNTGTAFDMYEAAHTAIMLIVETAQNGVQPAAGWQMKPLTQLAARPSTATCDCSSDGQTRPAASTPDNARSKSMTWRAAVP